MLRERASFSAASGRGREPCLTAPRWPFATLARLTIPYHCTEHLTSCARAGAHEHFTSPSQDSTWRSTDRCTATHNVNVQHRRASANQTVAIATLSFMKVSASTPFFRLASKHCSAGPITRQKWSEGFRQRQNFGSLFFIGSSYISSKCIRGYAVCGVYWPGRLFPTPQPVLAPTARHRFGWFSGTGIKKNHGRRSIFGRRCRTY